MQFFYVIVVMIDSHLKLKVEASEALHMYT